MDNQKYIHYWTGHYNLGDQFSNYLLDSIYDKDRLDQIDSRKTMIFIGSEIPGWSRNDRLCCGLGWRDFRQKLDANRTSPQNFLYTRGKISRQRVIQSGVAIPHDLPVGDTGLLASLLYRPKSAKTHYIGIITHWTGEKHHSQHMECAKKFFPDRDIAIMSMGDASMKCEDLFEFINSCKVVVASSLHAIIFSHSFGIPALYFKEQDTYKYKDYYSVYDRIQYDLDKGNSIQDALSKVDDAEFLKSVNPTSDEVKIVQRTILNAMPYRECFTELGNSLLANLGYDFMFMQNKDEKVLMNASSGGLVPEVMRHVMKNGGMCLGVQFDETFRKLKYVEVNESNFSKVIGSKYVDVMLSEELKQKMSEELDNGRTVLFIGRPCQCNWLRNCFKGKPNLVLVEILCYGVPEDNLWENYMDSLGRDDICSINFKDKRNGWNQYGFSMEFKDRTSTFEKHGQGKYMKDYLSFAHAKPKCRVCKFGHEIPSLADIVCGDAWGIESLHEVDTWKGWSIAIAKTKTGRDLLDSIKDKFNVIPTSIVELEKISSRNQGLRKHFPRKPHNNTQSAPNEKIQYVNPPKEGEKFDVIVSFSTYRLRMSGEDIYQSMESITGQKFNGKIHFVVNMWKSDYVAAPQRLKDYFNEHGIEVILSDVDRKTHNKYCHVFQKYKGIPIITFDDDQIYRKDAVQLLWNTHLNHPRTLIGGFCVIPTGYKDVHGNFIKPRPGTGTDPSLGIQVWGSGGNFYPPEFTKLIGMNVIDDWIKTMNYPSKYDNDQFLFRKAMKLGFLGMVVECNHKKPTWRGYLVEKFLPTADNETAKTWRAQMKKVVTS